MVSGSSSSSSTLEWKWKYEVFLSFRGEDTRNNFTDHLYSALVQRGIVTFRDDEQLEKGNKISSDLMKAIEESRFSIIVLSKSYANSGWCLDELAKIVDCVEMKKGHTALPVFCYVDPSHARKQIGVFEEDFDKHEQHNKEKVQRWRASLTKLANYSGWHLNKDRPETSSIHEIVETVWGRLKKTFANFTENCYGMDSHIEKINEYLVAGSDEVTLIGICGMGGIGKTTIARVVYDRLSYQFEGSSFLANVREVYEGRGIIPLQEQFLSQVLNVKSLNIHDVHEGINLIRRRLCRKKLFLVLDDVDQLKQLEYLVGRRDWFGCGSVIMITTRDEHLLTCHGVESVYKVRGLSQHDALQLFLSKAFKHDQPTDDHVRLSRHVVEYTNGLPLALEVLGSLLCNRNVKEWESALDRLKEFPDKSILKRLRISYDELEETEKKIFLDIACFFKGEDRGRVMEILRSCNFHPDIGIKVLIDKSLLTVSHNQIWMHDLLQEMGWEIVREEHRYDPGKWSRLWMPDDIYRVLTENMGTEVVEGIILDKPMQDITHVNGKSFSSMTKLRLLKIRKVQFSEDLEYLSNELRFIEWLEYPMNCLPSSFQPRKLFKLDMRYSCIEYLWEGIKHLKELKTIKLDYSIKLTRTPDFMGTPNLQSLDLEGCSSLIEVHQSVGDLKRLISLNLKDCKNLESFPSNICGLKSLRILNLHGCSKLYKLPGNLDKVECLEELDLSGTAVREVPNVAGLRRLITFSLKDCKYLETFPSDVYGLKSLKILNFHGCSKLERLPQNLGELVCLEELDLSGTTIREVPSSIVQLNNLKMLSFRGCWQQTPITWSSFICSILSPKGNPNMMCLRLLTLSGLNSLTKLDLSNCHLLELAIPDDIGSLFSLQELNLSGNSFITLPASINQLTELEYLYLRNCKMLRSLPQLPPKVYFVLAEDCSSLETIPKLWPCRTSEIHFTNCFKLVENQGMKSSFPVMLLKHQLQLQLHLQRQHNRSYDLSIYLPGSEIPKWFSYYWTPAKFMYNKGILYSETLRVPPNVINDEFLGFAACAVISPSNRPLASVKTPWMSVSLIEPMRCSSPVINIVNCTTIECDHVLLVYFSRKLFQSNRFIRCCGLGFAMGNFPGLVKSCGIRPVYKQDVQNFDVDRNFEELSAAEGSVNSPAKP